MNDFNLRPEVMGFGRPIRAEVVPPVAPAEAWKPHGKSFEINGLGQLRTCLALPSVVTSADMAMEQRDSGFVNVPYMWAGIDPAVQGSDVTVVAYGPGSGGSTGIVIRGCTWCTGGSWAPEVVIEHAPASAPNLTVQSLQAAGKLIDAQDVPQTGRMFWDGVMMHSLDSCHCDGCTASRQGRWAPHPSDDKRPLSEILAEAGKKAQAAAAPKLTTAAAAAKTINAEQAEYRVLQGLVVKLASECGKEHVRRILEGYGAASLRQVNAWCYAELRKRLQDDLDIPF